MSDLEVDLLLKIIMQMFFMHSIISGLIVGAIIKYASKSGSVTHINVIPAPGEDSQMNGTLLPPDALWLNFMVT